MAKDSLEDETELEKRLVTPPGLSREEFLEREAWKRHRQRQRGRPEPMPHSPGSPTVH